MAPLIDPKTGAFSPDGEAVFRFGMPKEHAPKDPRTGRLKSHFESPAFGEERVILTCDWKGERLASLWFYLLIPPNDRVLIKGRHDAALGQELGEPSMTRPLGKNRLDRLFTRWMSGLPEGVFDSLPDELIWRYPWGDVISGYEIRELEAIIRVVWRGSK